ncbi:alpha/beta hydrolase [Agreia sp. VKM Ac-1783]|jgi:pimeloyl-ACP methyl ester carboxylesterase|uniref:alpha/beta fold hydrolase n=1 Tax=Agreia sp. VKM Ac-1783 TaxID=1938889 RepID=UPI000A2AE920|nr:alpha/beta hydrolase [Agreia sp. VKM Ac-1783]SMQ70699.1 Pimeloyl-ACP methyl ester carboxylesterase [Agreia sp. VKM Ac-1783]
MTENLTVVLVHGAFAESASWSGVIAALQAKGVDAFATPNPLRSVTTDADNVRRAVESVGGPVVLVGHSYGGAVITEAAVGTDVVKGLVYVSAFAPDHGENSLQLTGQFPGSTLGETVRPYPLGDGTNDLIVDRELFPQQFAGDVPLDVAKISAATQRAIRDFALGEPQPAATPAWKTLPSWFIFGSGDKNIPVEGMRFMAERAGSLKTVELDGASHSSMVSHPDAVAELILEAVAHLS